MIPPRCARIVGVTALGRVGETRDIADVVAWLASDDARWTTGNHIDATGGRTRIKAFCKNESRLTWLRRILRSARASSLTRGKDALRSPAELAKAAAGGLSLRHPRRAPIAHRSSRPNAGTRETLARRAQDTVPPGRNRYFILQNALAIHRRDKSGLEKDYRAAL